MRHTNAFSESVKARLREPGQQFALRTDDSGCPRFRCVQYEAHTVTPAEPWTLSWRVTNSSALQPLRFRVEALMSTAPPGDTASVLLADLSQTSGDPWKRTTADGLSLSLTPATPAASEATLTATNSGRVPRNAAWARLERRFDPPLDLRAQQGLDVEIEGDGSGALAAIRLESPRHISFGALADRYVVLDFMGRRRFSLVETESIRWSDYVWNDGKSLYNAYRETIDFKNISSVSVWLQNLPSRRETTCRIGPIRAVPLRAGTVKTPKLVVAGGDLEFPVELASGSWLEANGPDDCKVYGSKGESLGKVTPRGAWPLLIPGETSLHFSCDSAARPQPRARVTIFSYGEQL
jgi:hypothetical protein